MCTTSCGSAWGSVLGSASRALLTLTLFAGACAARAPGEVDDVYAAAVEAAAADRPVRGAAAAWAFLAEAEREDPLRERARLLLASSLEGAGLSWPAAMAYRDLAQERRHLELVPDAMRGLERIISSGVYDDDALVGSFLAAESFGFLPDNLEGFTAYLGGLELARRGEMDWARRRFRDIPDGPYAARAAWVLAVDAIARFDDTAALEQLHLLRERDELPADVARDVDHALARLAYEAGDDEEAHRRYEALRAAAPDEPELLLELAWTAWRMDRPREALGLLIALDAPAHAAWVAPERFVLEALVLRRLCQWAPASAAARRLEGKHGASLAALRAGVPPRQVEALVAAARLRGLSRDHTRFLGRLSDERARAQRLGLGKELQDHLASAYERALEEANREAELQLTLDLAMITDELMAAEEAVGLIVHELSVTMLRGRRRPAGVEPLPRDRRPVTGDEVFYRFVGEYWTDELDDLVVSVEDLCLE